MELFKFQYTEKINVTQDKEQIVFSNSCLWRKNRINQTYTEKWENVTQETCNT